ncbi:MAG: phosphodiester glycosidase family protein, partial [Candidatus Nanopelagicales bacterium]
VRDSQGEPMNVLAAEWGRDHHLGGVIAAAENVYYAHFDTTPVGGTPTESVQVSGGSAPTTPAPGPSTVPTKPSRRHLSPPPTVVSPVGNPLPLEGVWQPVGSTVDGISAVYATRVRPDAVHTSVLASMMWIDTSLTHAMFIPGYIEPGGPAPSAGALPQQYWPQVLANFNGAFRLQDSQGGYFYNGTTVSPLQSGAASAVVYKNGSIKIGQWGRDISMTPSVAVVRQNLNLIVDGGRSQVTSSYQWGATTHGESLAWRSAIGQRADGSVVYVGSPGLSAASLADTLVRAGVVRAMVLDMNNWWVAGFYFNHKADGTPVCTKLDPNIQESCNRFLNRYKRDSFQFLAAP